IGVPPSSATSHSPSRSVQFMSEDESTDETFNSIRSITRSAFTQVRSIPMSHV
ncbi:unnamed protein product, partial [Rotaria socialis]